MSREKIVAKRVLDKHYKNIKKISEQAGKALISRNQKEVMLAYANGTIEIKKVQAYFLNLTEDMHNKLCDDIQNTYNNIVEIYNTSRNLNLASELEIEEPDTDDDNTLEDMFGGDQ